MTPSAALGCSRPPPPQALRARPCVLLTSAPRPLSGTLAPWSGPRHGRSAAEGLSSRPASAASGAGSDAPPRGAPSGEPSSAAGAGPAGTQPHRAASAAAGPSSGTEAGKKLPAEPPVRGVWGRVRRFFGGDKLDRQRLASLGMGAVASYGMVSNASYGAGMSIAWVTFVRRTGKSPLMAGEWPNFLAIYAGFWVLQNFLRPFRFSLAVVMAPFFDSVLVAIQRFTGLKRKGQAFALYLAMFACLSFVCIFGSIGLFAGPRAFARS